MDTFNFSKLSKLFSSQVIVESFFFLVVLVQRVKIPQKVQATISKAVPGKVFKQNVSLITITRK